MTSSHNTTCDVAVIGAGIAGLTCAEQLRQAGLRVVVIEKSRGFGGRAATKRLPDFRADHGLRYLERSGQLLPVFVDALRDRGVLVPWDARFRRVAADGSETDEAATTRYIAPNGANAIGKFLAQNLEVWRSRRAISLQPDGDRWKLQLEAVADGVDAPLSLTARCVVAAIPAPQAADLIADTPIAPDVKAAIAAVSYHPSISVMAGFPAELADADRTWDSLQFETGDLFWAGVESSKRSPEKERLVLTLHAAPEFAAEHLDAPDLDAVGRALLDRLAPHLSALRDRVPDFLVVHRWRYAFIDRPYPNDCISVCEPLPLVFGGDWCGTEQVETALRSGLAIAAEAARSLDMQALPTFPEIAWNLQKDSEIGLS
ncbi:MAG: NAD(P)/FAD-dependent oxidoreductase [Geitlerinemataceae cyanobacterium]